MFERPYTPAYLGTSQINIEGQKSSRLMVVYRTVGCAYDKDAKGCTMCNFAEHADPGVGAEQLLKQHELVRSEIQKFKPQHFDFLTLGNFFNEQEVPKEAGLEILKQLSQEECIDRVLIESRRSYVTLNKVTEVKNILGSKKCELGFGYESSHPDIRNKILNKGVPERHFREMLEIAKHANVGICAYVLIKPFTLSEEEGVADAVATAMHVLNEAKKMGAKARVAFEPVFVTHDKKIEEYFLRGEFKPPSLWSVIEVLRQCAERLNVQNTRGLFFVGLSDENLSEGRFSTSCKQCHSRVSQAIEDFNGHQEITRLLDVHCDYCAR